MTSNVSRWRRWRLRPQFRDEPQNLLEHLPCDGDLGHLEDNIASVAHHLRADLDQLLLQARQRPVLDRLRCCKRAEKVAKIVGEREAGAARALSLRANGDALPCSWITPALPTEC